MPEHPPKLPGKESLTRGLTAVFSHNGKLRGPLTVVRRESSWYTSTFPSETVTCRFDNGTELRLHCKYGGDRFYTGHGHRGGPLYEAQVYDCVLRTHRPNPSPAFYGFYSDGAGRRTWLVLEHLEDSLRVSKIPAGMVRAARWIGQFHAGHAVLDPSSVPFWLKKYDAEYYVGWARRTASLAGKLHKRFPWLRTLCERFEEIVPRLLSAPQTIIHGEYYPHNILYHAGQVCPVDWESAAIGAGEIDMASLTEGWPPATARRWERAYQRARWPDGAPSDFAWTLAAARLYLAFRWLGDNRESTQSRQLREYLTMLRAHGIRLGLI